MCQVNGSLNFFMLLPEEVKILDSKKKILFCQKKKKKIQILIFKKNETCKKHALAYDALKMGFNNIFYGI